MYAISDKMTSVLRITTEKARQPRNPGTRFRELSCFGRAGENGDKFHTICEEKIEKTQQAKQKYNSTDVKCSLKSYLLDYKHSVIS